MKESVFRLCFVASAILAVSGLTMPAAGLAAAQHPLLSYHPRAWQPPVVASRVAPAVVEGDGVAPAPIDAFAPGRSRAEALAGLKVETRADGSLHAALGGRIRAWTVATVGEDGELRLDCATSETAAIARTRKSAPAPAAPAGR